MSGSDWTAPQSRRTLRTWRRGERSSAVKTNSGTAVDTCTSCPAAIRCRTTCESRTTTTLIEIVLVEIAGRGVGREGAGRNLDGAGGVAEAVAGEVEGKDQAARRRWRAASVSGGRHCR